MKKDFNRIGATLCSSMRPRSATTSWLNKFKLLALVLMTMLSVNLWGADPTIVYSESFEGDDFVTSTTYNNSSENLHGPTSYQWGVLCGTPVANGHTGSKSMAMRYYNSVGSDPTLTQKFNVSGVNSISFYYKTEGTGTNNTMTVEYSTNSGSSWTVIGNEIALTTAYQEYSYDFGSTLTSVRLRISLIASTEKKSLWIDDVSFYGASITYTDFFSELKLPNFYRIF